MTLDLGAFGALTFDCYGTIIDWEAGILRVLRSWAERHRLPLDDEQLLGLFAQFEPEAERAEPSAPYRDVLRDTHRLIADAVGVIPDDAEAAALAESVGDWPAFADSAGALRRLGARYRLIVVSNVDERSFDRTRSALGVAFDAVVTAEAVGAYKPDRRMFDEAFAAAARLGVARERVLHVAQSLYHDHVPAKALGMRTVWIDRRGGRSGGATLDPGVIVQPDLTLGSLGELADLAGV